MEQAAKIVADVPQTSPQVDQKPALRSRILTAFSGWGNDEFNLWRRAFGTPAPFVLLLISLLALAIAWQVPFSYTLDSSSELLLEQTFAKNFDNMEQTPDKQWFRWSKGEGSFYFPGIGKRDYKLYLTVAGSANPNPTYVLYANKTKLGEGTLEAGIKTYEVEIPYYSILNKNGDLTIKLEVPGFKDPGSRRESLGFSLFSVKLEGSGNRPVLPPPVQLGWLVGLVMLAYALLARAGFGTWRAGGAAFLVTLTLAYIVATPGVRIWLTINSERTALSWGWALLMVILLDIPFRKFWQANWERRWALAIFGVALALRLTGLLHPQTELPSSSIVDLGFHQNRFFDFWQNGLWWNKIISTEWGSRPTYYPETVYVLIGFFQWLVPTTPDRARLLILLWIATFESMRVLLMFYLVKKVTGDGRTALIAGFLMAVLPINNLSLAWGQVNNLFGEWLVLINLCILVVNWNKLRQPLIFLILALSILGSFIVHPGVVLLSGTALLFALAIHFLRKETRSQAKFFGAAYLLALLLAFGSYHWLTVRDMVPQALQSLESRAQGGSVSETVKETGFRVGGQVRDSRMGLKVKYVQTVPEMLVEGAKGFWREAIVYFYLVPLPMFLWGMFWLWGSSRGLTDENAKTRRRLFWFGVAWFVTFVIFAATGLLLNLYVRYWVFLLPFIAIGAAIFLGTLWKKLENSGRGWFGAVLVGSLGLWWAISTIALFLDRIIYYMSGLN